MLDQLFPLSRQMLTLKQQPYVRYFIKTHDLKNRMSILVGQRGIGKSTALSQYMLANYDLVSEKLLYVPVDHFTVRPHHLYEIADTFYQHGGECICFDEIHKSPDWSITLKSIYDTFPNLKVLASGSSALLVHQGSHDLSRRAIVYRMHGMSFREFIELQLKIEIKTYKLDELINNHVAITHDIIQTVEQHNTKILLLFKNYLEYGYYPYFHELNDPNLFYITLEQNIHKTIESDLPSIYPHLGGAATEKLKQLLSFIATAVPFTPDLKALKTLLQIGDERTLKNYLQYMQDAEVITALAKANSGLKAIQKPEKIYLNNSSQLYALSGYAQTNIGTVRETFFASMLSSLYKISSSKQGDFIVDNQYTFEIGGKNKDFSQMKGNPNGYLACYSIETGHGKKIPLWAFGFFY